MVNLDRFAQDIPALTIACLRKEPVYCSWCGDETNGEEMHEHCKDEQYIREMPFGDFFNHFMEQTDGAEVAPEYKDGALDIWVWFDDVRQWRRCADLLEQRGLDCFVGTGEGHCVKFSVKAGQWKLEFQEGGVRHG